MILVYVVVGCDFNYRSFPGLIGGIHCALSPLSSHMLMIILRTLSNADQSMSPSVPHKNCGKPLSNDERHRSTGDAMSNSKNYQPLQSMADISRLEEYDTKVWVEHMGVPGVDGMSQHMAKSSKDVDSQEEDRSVGTDSDLLSVSDTSGPGICFDMGPFSQMQRHLLNYILEDYREATRYHSGDSSCAAPAPSASEVPTGSLSQTRSEKRKFNEQGSPVDPDDGRSTKVAKRAQ